MKNWLLAVALLLPLAGVCQSKSISAFYDKYENLEEVLNITLSGGVLKMITKHSDENGESDPIERVSELKVLVMEDGNVVKKSDLKALKSGIRHEKFEQLVQVRDEQTYVDIYIQEEGGIISNALLVVNEPDNFVMISLEGELSLKDLENIDIDVDGAEYFKKYNSKSKKSKRKKRL